MAIKHVCDICGKEIKNIKYILSVKRVPMTQLGISVVKEYDLCSECKERFINLDNKEDEDEN